jgi:hypothetical protein
MADNEPTDDDREPLWIEPGWYVEDLKTLEECDDAELIVRESILNIEFQLDKHKAQIEDEGARPNLMWMARRKRGLGMRRLIAQKVAQRAAIIRKQMRQQENITDERRFLEFIKAKAPEQFRQWGDEYRSALALLRAEGD